MKKIFAIKLIFIISFFLLAGSYLYAECYNEDTCFKDYISEKDQNTVLAVNRETNEVELYWSDKDQTWIKPDRDYRKHLQKIYNKKLQLRSMQSHLDSMRRENEYTRNQSSGSGLQR